MKKKVVKTSSALLAAMKAHTESLPKDDGSFWKEQQADPVQMQHWLPILESLVVPVPKTVSVDMGEECFKHYINGNSSSLITEFAEKVHEAVKKIGGYPCFIRNGVMSGKHGWKDTCYLSSKDEIVNHVYAIMEINSMAMAPLGGTWFVRKLIKTKTFLKSFYGEMPITREARVFVEGGKVICLHPYWPITAIEPCKPKVNLVELMEKCNTFSPKDLESLKYASAYISNNVKGYWSIDWLQGVEGEWWCIDMAPGRKSYHWKSCDLKK